jgi:hypothetical protein
VNNKASISDLTIGDVVRSLRRYQPFIATVVAVVLLVAVLPGKSGSGSSTQAVGTVNGTSPAGTTLNGAAATGQQQPGVNGAVGQNGALPGVSGVSGGGAVPAVGGTSGGGAVGATGSAPATAGGPSAVSAPTVTNDQWCDRVTGRVKIPTQYAPHCVPAWSGNNGGNTYNGVTAKTITVAVPLSNNQAQAQAVAAAANDTDTQQQVKDTLEGYLNIFTHHMQTYGRSVVVKYFTSSYNSNDPTSAQNAECQSDATKIAKSLHAFITVDAFAEECGTVAYQNTLARLGVLCWCTVTVPESYYLQWAPYIWGTGLPDETSAYLMRAEVICNEIAPYPPDFAGEADLKPPVTKARSFGLIWPGASSLDNTDAYKAGAAFFADQLRKCGIDLKENVSFPIVDTNGPADAQTLMAKFKNKKITDVILVADPIDPIYLTGAATKQNYFPEWIDTGSALTDETHFGRLYDQTQWKNAFGVSFLPDRVPPSISDAWNVWHWANAGQNPPASYSAGTLYLFALSFMSGVQLAGPHLTPQSFQCGEPPYTSQTHSGPLGSKSAVACVGKVYPGMFGAGVAPTNYKARIANPVVSWGSQVWPWDDYNVFDDGTLIWWDPSASGPDETNSQGVGMWRYMRGGKRYLYGQFPRGQQPWFDKTGTVTVFSSVPSADRAPAYPYRCYYLC